MTYQETIDYLFSRLPLFSQTGKAAYKTDITNTVILCEAIGDPQKKIKTIHVAGTNGKGSTSHMLAAIFQESGFRSGLYTSPHLKDFRERIKIDGEIISKDFIVDFVEKIKPVTEKISPSFFEVTVALAFDYFLTEKVDIAIIETGLGGRLDSTNIILPELSVITNIGFDHMNILGYTLREIAGEKAGIIKKNTPVVVGETLPETKSIFIDKAKSLSAPIIFAEELFDIAEADLKDAYLEVSLRHIFEQKETIFRTDLTGLYQQKNVRTVITAINVLIDLGYDLKPDDILNGLLKVKALTGLHGRWDILQQHPLVVLDVAHNEDGMRLLIQQIKSYTYKNLHLVFGIVKDKDAAKILSILPREATYYFTNAQIPRALPAATLAAKAEEFGLKGKIFASINKALSEAINAAEDDDMIIVCGSVFVVAEVDTNIFAINGQQ